MPTILTHAIVPLAAGIALGSNRVTHRMVVAGMVAAMLPDADVLAFAFGIPYADAFGHRGVSHSLMFAAALATLGASSYRWLGATFRRAWFWLFACAASHPLLDAFTNGGLGVALFWPWSDLRVFAPWRPIRVSPIGLGFFGSHGIAVLVSELRWVWLPAATFALLGLGLRHATGALSSRR
ncbi:metal-dependent hydrolase [Lysobacter niastensis]|uniref:Metal-dependent hydrolase n=1 Tax=Lysobacter niastensis TaxID=380629 RepID=A0ABS0BFR9_9GAMM|nr:metal-dependent hydrolase [Lysobacter niastensis]MBF6025905.1 metal-dependent hydrolase [Lysobacter niastensis]